MNPDLQPVYVNQRADSPIRAVEFDARTRSAFFFVRNEGDVGRAREIISATGQSVLTQSQLKGETVLVVGGFASKEHLLGSLSAKGESFAPAEPEKRSFLQFLKKEGWKIRGGSSVVGQSMTLYSAFKSVSMRSVAAHGSATPRFDPATGAFAALNLTANFINWVFGGQKEEDKAGLAKFNGIIADEINRYLPGGATPISEKDVHKLSYMDDAERDKEKQEHSAVGILRKNSVRLGEVGLRTLGSIFLMFNYRKIVPAMGELCKGRFSSAFTMARTADTGTFMAGCGMVAGKAMGLLAQTYDPNNPPKTYLGEIRQKVLWTTSSFTEMIAQSYLSYDRFKDKRLAANGVEVNAANAHQFSRDYVGGVGNIILTVPPYPTRLVLPYGEKVLDVDEVQARLLDELPKLPPEKIPEVVARISARMDEHLGAKSPGFSKLYGNLMFKLDTYHHIKAGQEATVAPAIAEADAGKPTLKISGAQHERVASHPPLAEAVSV